MEKRYNVLLSSIAAMTLIIVLASALFAQQPPDLEIPAPPRSKFLETTSFRLTGKDIKGTAYSSLEPASVILNFYRRFFKENDFELSKDMQMGEMFDKTIAQIESQGLQVPEDTQIERPEDIHQLRYKRGELVVDLYLTPKPEGSEVSVLKYVQPEGEPDLEESRFSVTDSFFEMPTQDDEETEDLMIIPRPPESVRISGLEQGEQTFLTYTSSLSTQEAVDYYKLSMQYQSWELMHETSSGELKKSGALEQPGVSMGLDSVLKESESLSQTADDSHSLYFSGRYGQAFITILPNFIDRKLGSIVQIVYNEPRL